MADDKTIAAHFMVTLPDSKLKEQFREDPNRLSRALSYPEICECDHIIAGIGYRLSKLIQSSHDFPEFIDTQLSLCNSGDLKAQSFIKKLRICLAQQLLEECQSQRMSLVDYILETQHPHKNIQELQSPTFQLNASGTDEFASLLLRSLTAEFSKSLTVNTKENWEALDTVPNTDQGNWPPPLPDIDDPVLLRQIFTHRSAIQCSPPRPASELQQVVNERLEYKGDSLLDLIIVNKLCATFPTNSEGDLTKFKAALVNNNQLWEFAMIYKLADRLHVGVDSVSRPYMPDGRKNKALADTFEAYIAGVAINKGYGFTQKWLLSLYEPFIQMLQGNKFQSTSPISEVPASISSSLPLKVENYNKNAKAELYALVGSAEQPIQYHVENNESLFKVTCVVNNEILGTGIHNNSKIAGTMAAMEALTKKDTLAKLSAERRKQRQR